MTFSRNWLEPSLAAKEQDVCHTKEETKLMYSEIPKEQKDAAIKAFRNSGYYPAFPEIREAIAKNSDGWNIPYHFTWGMGVRNFFRQESFGEKYFGVDNLDCIYKYLVEDAVKE